MGRNANPDPDDVAEKLKPMELPPLGESPLVSVLMGNYNYGRYIGEALDSVLRQTYSNFEVIVCDDGSTDDSREVVARYCDRDTRIRMVVKENGGLASALNAAYAASRGEIICLLDADDVFLPSETGTSGRSVQRARAGRRLHSPAHQDGQRRTYVQLPTACDLERGLGGSPSVTQRGAR